MCYFFILPHSKHQSEASETNRPQKLESNQHFVNRLEQLMTLTLIRSDYPARGTRAVCSQHATSVLQNVSVETPTQELRRAPNEGYWSIVLLRNNIIDIYFSCWFQSKRDSLYRSLVTQSLCVCVWFLPFKLRHGVQMLPGWNNIDLIVTIFTL